MHPFALIASNRAEGREWIAEHFPDTSGWFEILTPRTHSSGAVWIAAYATPQALARRNELRIGRVFKLADRGIRIARPRLPEQVL